MTKKDFEAIAAAIRDATEAAVSFRPESADSLRRVHGSMARTIATTLAPTNPRFDRARFLQACGVTRP